jgi:tetratricopeptide (TPR) repeat protein
MKRFDRLEFEPSGNRVATPESAPLREPDHDERHWLKQAITERRNGMHESALRLYSRALEMDKSLVAGWAGQVQMLIALGEYPEAELWARKALELFKNNADLLAGRSQAFCRIGDFESALASSDASVNQQGLGPYPFVARGELMLARKEKAEEHCFEKAVQLDRDWLVRLDIANVYLFHDRPTKALAWIRRAVEEASDHAYCWYFQGRCEIALGLDRAAEASFKRCLQLAPKHADARRELEELKRGGKGVRNLFRRWFRS